MVTFRTARFFKSSGRSWSAPAQHPSQLSTGPQAVPQAAGHVVPLPPMQPPRHSAVHAHELPQSIPVEQLLTAPHDASQVPVPHSMPPPQDPLPEHVAVQSTAPPQSIPLLQVVVAVHATLHVVAEQITGD